MIPVSTLFDEYIDRPKLTQQKDSFEYKILSPTTGSEQIRQKKVFYHVNAQVYLLIYCKNLVIAISVVKFSKTNLSCKRRRICVMGHHYHLTRFAPFSLLV